MALRHDFCERSLSPQDDNKSEIKVEFTLFSLFPLLCRTTLSPTQLFEEDSFNFHWFIFYIFKNPLCARGGQSFTESAWLKRRNTQMALLWLLLGGTTDGTHYPEQLLFSVSTLDQFKHL